MREWFRGQGKSLREDLEKWVRSRLVKAVEALSLMALTLWGPSIWHWLRGIDPEVGRQAIFFLSVVLVFSVLGPSRRLPIRLVPVERSGNRALVAVKNRGEAAEFYAGLEVVGEEEGSATRAPVRPTWTGSLVSDRTRLNRDQAGVLCLARIHPVRIRMFNAMLEDFEGSEERLIWSERHPLRVRVRLTISRDEEGKWFLPVFLRPARSFVAEVAIRCDENGELSVEEAPAARRRWWRLRRA